jgi:hypothetical protein
MKSRHAAALALAPIVLTLGSWSCDMLYGVSRGGAIDSMPSLDCVRKVVLSAPGVTSIEYRQTEGRRPISWSGIEAADAVHTFLYKGAAGSHVMGVLQIISSYNGKVQFSQHLLAINVAPSQADIDATRPVMRCIEKALGSQCGLSALSSQVTEWCRGVQCSPMHDP